MEQFEELGFRCDKPSNHPNYYSNNNDGTTNDLLWVYTINEPSDVRIAKLPVFPRAFSMQLKTDKLSAEGFAELERQKHMQRLELSGEKKLDPFLPILENLDSVKALSLNDRLITPAILRGIAKMPSIDELQIFETADMKTKRFFDSNLNIKALAKIKRIRTLGLSGTSVRAMHLAEIEDNRYTGLILQDWIVAYQCVDRSFPPCEYGSSEGSRPFCNEMLKI